MADLGCSYSAAVAFDFLLAKGLRDYQAAAVVGNLQQESRLDPNSFAESEGAYGIAQWRNERRQSLLAFAAASGNSASALDTQLEFLWYELESNRSFGLDDLRASSTLEEATIVFQDKFERCSACAPDNRIRFARSALFACPGLNPPAPRKKPIGALAAAAGVVAMVAAAGYGTYSALLLRGRS